MSHDVVREVAARKKLQFAVLVYREEVRPGERLWFARSVLTSDVAPGDTKEEALDNLKSGVLAALKSARARGQSPKQWYEGQVRDDPKWLAEFCSLATVGCDRVEMLPPLDGFELEAGVITRAGG